MNLKELLRIHDNLDERSVNFLIKSLAKNNREGFDYLEFLAAVEKLKQMPMDDQTAYRSALATASTFGITTDKLVESGLFYQKVLKDEFNHFREALRAQIQTRITEPANEAERLKKDNEQIDREIENLKAKQKLHTEKMRILSDKVAVEREALKEKEVHFKETFEYLTDIINTDINKLKQLHS